MKAETAKRLAILIIALGVVGGAGFFTQQLQLNKLAAKELKKAELAFSEGDFAQAAMLLRGIIEQRLPNDHEIQLKYANALLKSSRSPSTKSDVLGIYRAILRKNEGREDVRKLLLDLKVEMKQLVSSRGADNGADVDLNILLARKGSKNQTDGHLWYLMGQCHEAEGDDAKAVESAVESYGKAVEYNAPEKIQAGERRAILLHEKLNQPTEAQQVIDKLVETSQEAVDTLDKSAPNYDRLLKKAHRTQAAAHRARGRFRLAVAMHHNPSQKTLERDATNEFEQARKLDPTEPEVYLQLAQAVTRKGKSGYEEARRILEDGLAKTSCDLQLILSLSDKSNLPAHGENLIIVAVSQNKLYVRIFDHDGQQVIDTDETKLTAASAQIAELREAVTQRRSYLKGWNPSGKLTDQQKSEVINRLISIVGYVPPIPAAIYESLAILESFLGNVPRAVEILELALMNQPDHAGLRLKLADLLANRGDTGKLLLQIKELKKLGHSRTLTQYFTACYHINARQFLKARHILLTLQSGMRMNRNAEKTNRAEDLFRSKISVLLAQCYKELGEPEMQQNEYFHALSANPHDLKAKVGWITSLVSQGDIAGAIKEYRAIVKDVPGVRPVLIRLLITQNQRRPEPQRDWSEVNELINQMSGTETEAIEVLRAELLFTQGNRTAALANLKQAQTRFPKSVEIRIAQTNMMGVLGQVDQAFALLDQAQQQLGDLVDLRLERARLWALKKGPQFHKVLIDLSQNTEKFSKADRKRLLNGLAIEFKRQQDPEGASQVWAQLAAEEPTNIELRLNLLDLALQSANKEDIEKNIKQIEEIENLEGDEGLLGRYCQLKYLIWQAERAGDKASRYAIQLKAHRALEDLVTRRGDWSLIPLAQAQLAEQELAQGNLSEDEIRAKEEIIIGYLRRAIDLGQHSAAIVRRTVQLLFKNKRGNDALDLLSRIPVESQLGSDLGHQAEQYAVENRDFQRAEQIARKAIQAKPDDFQERIWLVRILLASEHETEAEAELREAVNRSPGEPDRWDFLVGFLIFITKQLPEAEKVIRQAETKLLSSQQAAAKVPSSQALITLASCCENIGKAYEAADDGAAAKKWNTAARTWYERAQAAQPEDLSIKRRLAEFFIRSKQLNAATDYLKAIRNQEGGETKNGQTARWANRTLALVLASSTDRTQQSNALTLFEPDGKSVPPGQEGKYLTDPEDLRVLAQVLALQKTPVYAKRAIEILESLADKNLATSDNQFDLARLYEVVGNWPRAREKYRELNLRTRTLRDMETLNRRPSYLAQFADSLLRHHTPDDQGDLAEAQELVDEIRQLQPMLLATVILQVRIYQIRNEIDRAVQLIQTTANRRDLAPQVLGTLAELAEKIKQPQLAEQLYRRLVSQTNNAGNKLLLAAFLGRYAKIKDGLDLCEPLWNNTANTEVVAVKCIDILFGSEENSHTPDSAQINRVASWIERAVEQARKERRRTSLLLIGLGNVRERQGLYGEAEKLYNLATQEGDPDGLSWNNRAWLAALKDKKYKEALNYANQAISLKPDHPDFLDTRGMIYLLEGNPKLALEDFQRAVAIDPASPSKRFHLVQAFLANGDKEKAKQSFDMAKAKGFTPSGLHALEQQNSRSVLNQLGSP
jgi:cellulose synthase operon protein C